MKVWLSESFDRHYASRLNNSQRNKIIDTIRLFEIDPYNREFRNHGLKGQWSGYRSISIGGDLRIHYRQLDKDSAVFVAVGTHAQLYK